LKIETLVNLIGGELLNSPYISEVTSFTDDKDSVTRGGCFFVKKSEDIKKAVKNGAYAIVSENFENIIDKEIAWIKVDSIEKSVFDIFKYENLKSKVFYTDDITLHIIEKMNLNNNLIILNSTADLLKALNINNKYLLTSDKIYCELFSNIEMLVGKDLNLKQQTLFKSIYEKEEINLPFVYKDEFSKAIKFFEDNELKYTLEFELDRFKPQFIDFKFRKVAFGESDRVLILGIKNDKYFFKELNYLIDNTKHAKTVIVNEENKELLNEFFNFAMLVDFEVEFNEIKEERLF
jgi:ferrochelatase